MNQKRSAPPKRTGAKKSPAPRVEPEPINAVAEELAEACLTFIDVTGRPPVTKLCWIEMNEHIIAGCRSRIEAAREELAMRSAHDPVQPG